MPEPRIDAGDKLPRLRGLIDRSSWMSLGLLALAWTLMFAFFYTCLTVRNRGYGLKLEEYPEYRWQVGSTGVGQATGHFVNAEPNPVPWPTAWNNSLYFSIATETTVGYGDLVPHGVSRILACLQALGGLMFAGVFVTKITTGLSGKTKYLVHRIEGQWVEFSITKDDCSLEQCLIVSLITIKYVDGLLHYDGSNYDHNGSYRRGFQGSSQPIGTITGRAIWFDYSNLRGDDEQFKEGRSRLQFKSLDREKQLYMEFDGKAEDSGREKVIPMFGQRATDNEAETIKLWQDVDPSSKAMCAVASSAFDACREKIRSFAALNEVPIRAAPSSATAAPYVDQSS